MYSNDKKGFSILDLLVKIIFAGIFIFILVWLFQKKIPNINMTPFYSNVFRENIKYMQDAGESYFTDDKMPTEAGQSVKLSLEEMERLNLLIPFVDKDGNACDKNASYVSVTKLEDDKGYELKTNLVCSTESNFITKILGCHTYCPNGNCNKVCSVEKITEYQYKKLVSKSSTSYSCPKGYTLKGKYCYSTVVKDSYDGSYTDTVGNTVTIPATLVMGDSSYQQLTTQVNKTQLTTQTSKTQLTTQTNRTQLTTQVNKTQLTTNVTTSELTPVKTPKEETYSCTKTRTETQCKTEIQRRPYNCNCKTTIINGVPTTTCNTCYESVEVQKCYDVEVEYTGTCTKTVYTYSCPSGTTDQTGSGSSLKCYKKTYSCPSGTTEQTGSGSSLKCYKGTYSCPSGTDYQTGSGSSLKCYKTTYSCPSGTTEQTGSGSSLKCYKTTYSCPSGTTEQTGSGSSLKCYKTTYSCPSGTDYQSGSGSSLKCYRIISGSAYYTCPNSGYVLSGSNCKMTTYEIVTKYKCKSGYKLEGKMCILYDNKEEKATKKTTSKDSYKYTWSTKTSLSGWTKTGKTREVDGEEVCK